MYCENCGGALEQYELAGASAKHCPDCGFVGVPVDHRPEPPTVESWSDAFQRFYETANAGGMTVASDGGRETDDPDETA